MLGGRYEIVRELGRGGMGAVFLARQVNLGRLVVIKQVLPGHSQKHVDALVAEAHLAARLHHPNIVDVLDVGDDEPFVAMEYVAGVTLRDIIDRAPTGLPPEVAITIAIDVLRGLHYAHTAKSTDATGIVHRDVKPRNVMVSFAGDAKLIDFGISRWLSDEGGWEATSISGTLGYMAPEQQAGERVDGRADQFAVAITLREMLVGNKPSDERTADLRVASAGPQLDRELAALLDQAGARDRTMRYADCAAFVDALETYARARDIAATSTSVERWLVTNMPAQLAAVSRDELGKTAPPTKAGTARAPTTSPPPRSRRALAIVVALLVAAGAAGVVLWLARSRTPAATTAGTLVVALDARADEPWIALATEHLARRALRDVDERRFWIVPPRDARATRTIALVARRTPEGIHLDARDGETTLASADAPSIYEAVGKLVAPVATSLGRDRSSPGPDADEQAEMTRIGARTFDQFRKFRTLAEDARLPTWLDSTAITPGHEALLRDDPTWLHPYAELEWLYGPAQSTAIVAVAAAKGDRARDPIGAGVLDALEAAKRGDAAASLAAVKPLYDKGRTDPLVVEPYSTALGAVDHGDVDDAMYALLAERYPDQFFIGNIATHLTRQGRDQEAEQTIRASVAAHPENAVSARELVRIEAQAGHADAAREAAQHMLLIHGERPLVLAELYEAMVLSDDLAAARRIVNRMLLGSALARARGNYRSAVLAVFEGRFAAARPLLDRAVDEFAPFGPQDRETPQSLLLASQLAAAEGDYATGIAKLDALGKLEAAHDDPGLNLGSHKRHVELASYRALMLGTSPTCPKIAPDDHTLVAKLRLGAAADCAACEDVVAAGFQNSEPDPEALVSLGRCALKLKELALARRSLERATQLWLTWTNHDASPYFAVLAHYELARVLAAQGDTKGARTEYQRFVHYWGNADRAMPEVAAAQRVLAKP